MFSSVNMSDCTGYIWMLNFDAIDNGVPILFDDRILPDNLDIVWLAHYVIPYEAEDLYYSWNLFHIPNKEINVLHGLF